ncbi:MAG: iron-containing alcohol dehydrogenase [Lentimicrobiaceae bacterium]|jgi:NADP-dependent alcohol dehydrogenase|nr:iron-containing alcohol dehydrogenase [Lentimicrobiaceae bacterium]MDD4597794.1 iron-containing alcohol dehydrogenase [Lentimicrobiaceae bacterium]MDY0025475.1 iron-containing alcohol dehydrogenase [Lentimicrobium sp.]HAH58814.1 NADH-dependent alcohol dehydrogenase [Bacteroidales bacterium]
MKNFNFYNPVRILFGKGKIAEIGKYIPENARIMITYGGGSIMKNGVYDQVIAALKGKNVVEFGGIEANPQYETLLKAVEKVKAENVDFLLAVGGGSVLDGTKFIAAAAYYDGDEPWEILSRMRPIRKAMPLASVITLAATGSEMNSGGVITRAETQEKLSFGSPLLFPQFSVLDPEVTFSLPKQQVANGIVDAYIHVIEQYLTYPVNTPIQDRFAEGILLTLIEEGPKAINNPEPDYDNRANLMWAATMALNGQLSLGVETDWATHMIGHELTAYHGIDHAVTLAIVLPGVMRLLKEKRSEKLLQYAERVWNITQGREEDRIESAIKKTEQFFKSLGIGIRLSDHEVGEDTIDRIIERFNFRRMKTVGNQKDISVEDVRLVLEDVK